MAGKGKCPEHGVHWTWSCPKCRSKFADMLDEAAKKGVKVEVVA